MQQTSKTRSFDGCNNCKDGRIKCDRQKPICNVCRRRGLNCDYSLRLKWVDNEVLGSTYNPNEEYKPPRLKRTKRKLDGSKDKNKPAADPFAASESDHSESSESSSSTPKLSASDTHAKTASTNNNTLGPKSQGTRRVTKKSAPYIKTTPAIPQESSSMILQFQQKQLFNSGVMDRTSITSASSLNSSSNSSCSSSSSSSSNCCSSSNTGSSTLVSTSSSSSSSPSSSAPFASSNAATLPSYPTTSKSISDSIAKAKSTRSSSLFNVIDFQSSTATIPVSAAVATSIARPIRSSTSGPSGIIPTQQPIDQSSSTVPQLPSQIPQQIPQDQSFQPFGLEAHSNPLPLMPPQHYHSQHHHHHHHPHHAHHHQAQYHPYPQYSDPSPVTRPPITPVNSIQNPSVISFPANTNTYVPTGPPQNPPMSSLPPPAPRQPSPAISALSVSPLLPPPLPGSSASEMPPPQPLSVQILQSPSNVANLSPTVSATISPITSLSSVGSPTYFSTPVGILGSMAPTSPLNHDSTPETPLSNPMVTTTPAPNPALNSAADILHSNRPYYHSRQVYHSGYQEVLPPLFSNAFSSHGQQPPVQSRQPPISSITDNGPPENTTTTASSTNNALVSSSTKSSYGIEIVDENESTSSETAYVTTSQAASKAFDPNYHYIQSTSLMRYPHVKAALGITSEISSQLADPSVNNIFYHYLEFTCPSLDPSHPGMDSNLSIKYYLPIAINSPSAFHGLLALSCLQLCEVNPNYTQLALQHRTLAIRHLSQMIQQNQAINSPHVLAAILCQITLDVMEVKSTEWRNHLSISRQAVHSLIFSSVSQIGLPLWFLATRIAKYDTFASFIDFHEPIIPFRSLNQIQDFERQLDTIWSVPSRWALLCAHMAFWGNVLATDAKSTNGVSSTLLYSQTRNKSPEEVTVLARQEMTYVYQVVARERPFVAVTTHNSRKDIINIWKVTASLFYDVCFSWSQGNFTPLSKDNTHDTLNDPNNENKDNYSIVKRPDQLPHLQRDLKVLVNLLSTFPVDDFQGTALSWPLFVGVACAFTKEDRDVIRQVTEQLWKNLRITTFRHILEASQHLWEGRQKFKVTDYETGEVRDIEMLISELNADEYYKVVQTYTNILFA